MAFEIYADDVTYYHDQRNPGWDYRWMGSLWQQQSTSMLCLWQEIQKVQTEICNKLWIGEDYPSRMEIHKVEDGDSMVGNQNVLQKTDAQGQTKQARRI